MKRNSFFFALFTAFAVVFLCACDSPEEVVENFYEALYDGDFDDAQKYCSDDAKEALVYLESITDENPEAMVLWNNDMAFEKSFFRLLTADEIAYQKQEDEKQKKADEKQKKDQRQQLTKEEFEAIRKEENDEKEALEDAVIVYSRWSKGLVYKHYLIKSFLLWKIVKIENGHTLPERMTKGN